MRIIRAHPGGDYFFIPLHVAWAMKDTGLISGQPHSLFVSGKGGAPASPLVPVLESINGHQLGLAGFSEKSRGAQWSKALELTLQQLFPGQHGFWLCLIRVHTSQEPLLQSAPLCGVGGRHLSRQLPG